MGKKLNLPMAVVEACLERNTLTVAAAVAVVVAAEDNTDIVLATLSLCLNSLNTLHKLELDILAPETATPKYFFRFNYPMQF